MRSWAAPLAAVVALAGVLAAGTAGAADNARPGFMSPATGAMPVVGWPTPEKAPANPPATTWRRNAVTFAEPPEPPMLAVVLDDMGLYPSATRRAIGFPDAVTLAFLPYVEDVDRLADAARAAGHELLLHLPMEARGDVPGPGPHHLTVDAGPADLLADLGWNLDRFDGFVGVNNHMGSRFTADRRGMRLVMRRLKARGLLFLDSLTTADSVAEAAGRAAGVPVVRRDVFLGGDSREQVRRRLDKAVAQAERIGHAVVIGHPDRATMAVLAEWLPDPPANVTLVPLSAIPRHAPPLADGDGGGTDRQRRKASAGKTGGES